LVGTQQIYFSFGDFSQKTIRDFKVLPGFKRDLGRMASFFLREGIFGNFF